VHHETDPKIDWGWLEQQRAVIETDTLRLVEIDRPLEIAMDGRSGRGAILYELANHIHNG
jgi:hypothetical protein